MVVLFLAQNIEITKLFFIKTALLKNKIIISFVKLVHKSFVSWNKKSSLEYTFNPLIGTSNSATSNNMKLVHWPQMSKLLHLVQQGAILKNIATTNNVIISRYNIVFLVQQVYRLDAMFSSLTMWNYLLWRLNSSIPYAIYSVNS